MKLNPDSKRRQTSPKQRVAAASQFCKREAANTNCLTRPTRSSLASPSASITLRRVMLTGQMAGKEQRGSRGKKHSIQECISFSFVINQQMEGTISFGRHGENSSGQERNLHCTLVSWVFFVFSQSPILIHQHVIKILC